MSVPVVALQGNYSFLDKLFTTLKSLLYHNQGVKVYVLNPDIPQEWFKNVNQQLGRIGDEIIDIKVDQSIFADSDLESTGRMNSLTFNKLLLPKLFPQERVLYIDSDVVVNHSLQTLFSLDFSEPVAVVKDLNSPEKEFNAGVVLFNNPVINRDPTLTDQLIETSKQEKLANADQTVLSKFFYDQCKFLPRTYNYEVGVEGYAVFNHISRITDELATVTDPILIHFDSDDKPWKMLSTVRYRDLWWYYNGLSIRDIIDHITLGTSKPQWAKLQGPLFCMTNSQEFSNLIPLIEALPDYQFEIGARTKMGPKLLSLLKYPNVRLYQGIFPDILVKHLEQAHLYLDINYGMKDNATIQQFLDLGKPVLAFNSTASLPQSNQYLTFGDDQVTEMVKWIRERG